MAKKLVGYKVTLSEKGNEQVVDANDKIVAGPFASRIELELRKYRSFHAYSQLFAKLPESDSDIKGYFIFEAGHFPA